MQLSPQCLDCLYYKGKNKCKAFKDIPIEILVGEHNHKDPFNGDNGILFKPLKP